MLGSDAGFLGLVALGSVAVCVDGLGLSPAVPIRECLTFVAVPQGRSCVASPAAMAALGGVHP